MCLSAGGSPWGSTTLRLLLREPLWVFLKLWGWADARAERPYFVLAWWFSGHGMPCPYIASLVVGLTHELSDFLSSHSSRSRLDRSCGWTNVACHVRPL